MYVVQDYSVASIRDGEGGEEGYGSHQKKIRICIRVAAKKLYF